MHTKKAGDQVGRYVIEAPLGAGGMGEVYEARDTRLGRRVALKLLRGDAKGAASQRLLREAQAAASFEHPNVIVVYDVGEADGEMFIAMELVRGKSLRRLLDPGSAPVGRKLRWLVDIARALGAAHRAGLIHRDIKPDNIVLRDDGTTKVLDFGIARKQPPSRPPTATQETALLAELATITAEGALVGTPRYWAPEQLRGEEIDGRVDQFAWAVTAFELLAGRPPWTADEPVKLLSQILTAAPPALRELALDVPEDVEHAIVRALSKHAADRFASIDEAADAIEPFAEAAPSLGRGAGAQPPKSEGEGRGRSGPRTPSIDPSGMTREAGGAAPEDRGLVRPTTARSNLRWIAPIAGLAVAAAALAIGARALQPRSPADNLPTASAPPLVVSGLACEEAKLQGNGALPELAPAIGIGACARLAVELGVDWTVSGGADRVGVSATLEGGGAEITMTVRDRKATASGSSAAQAMGAAAAALSKQLAAPPMSRDEILEWGAKDEDTARKIDRTLRRILLDFGPDDQALAKELIEAAPESAMTYFIAVAAEVGGLEKIAQWQEKALALASSLPPARSKTLRALLEKQRLDPGERLRLLRQAYAEAPDDMFVAGSYGNHAISSGAEEEGFAVLDRLHARVPSRATWYTYKILAGAPRRDLDREEKYIDRLRAILPETVAWHGSVMHVVLKGDVEEARRRLALGLNLGIAGAAQSSFYAESARAWVELVAFEPKAARELAAKMIGEPRPIIATEGASVTLASYLLEGRIDDAEEAQLREIERYKDGTDVGRALSLAAVDLRQRRLLGRRPPDAARLAWMKQVLEEKEKATGQIHFLYRAELAFALAESEPSPAKRKAYAERALAELEAAAEKQAAGDRLNRDTALVKLLPLVRVVRGDAGGTRLWRETEKANIWTRLIMSFDAALALEAVGETAMAEKAYLLSQDATLIQDWTLQVLAARIRLAALYRAQKRDAEATKLDEVVSRLWAGADPGLREAILKLR